MIGARATTVRAVVGVVVLVTAAACGGDPAPTTTAPPEFPSVVVDAWLDALVTGDYAHAAGHVEPIGASLVLASENSLSDDELAELIESGWTPELAISFWASFRDEFGLFAGADLADLVVGRHETLDVDGVEFARVRISVDSTEGWILTRATDAGVWQVDLLATLGGAFAPLVYDRVSTLGDDPVGELISDAVADTALGSLDAAAIVYPDDARLVTEIARIRQALAGLD